MNRHLIRNVVRDAAYPLNTSNMILYSGATCPFSHRCRIVLYEKQMDFQLIDVDLHTKSEDTAAINPYDMVPALVHRDLVLHHANIITEYLDERFPHPQLMPSDLQVRARAPIAVYHGSRTVQPHRCSGEPPQGGREVARSCA